MTSFPLTRRLRARRRRQGARRSGGGWWARLGAFMATVVVGWVGRRPARAGRRPLRRARPPGHTRLAQAGLLLTVTDDARVLAPVLPDTLLLARHSRSSGSSAGAGGTTGATRARRTAATRRGETSTEQVVALFQDGHQRLHQRSHRRLLFGQPYLALEEHVWTDAGGAEATLAIVCPERVARWVYARRAPCRSASSATRRWRSSSNSSRRGPPRRAPTCLRRRAPRIYLLEGVRNMRGGRQARAIRHGEGR